MVEWLLLTQEVRGSNVVIGKLYVTYLLPTVPIEKTKIKEKDAVIGAIFTDFIN